MPYLVLIPKAQNGYIVVEVTLTLIVQNLERIDFKEDYRAFLAYEKPAN